MSVNFYFRIITEKQEASVASLRNFFSTVVTSSAATGQAHTMTIKETDWQNNINAFITCDQDICRRKRVDALNVE